MKKAFVLAGVLLAGAWGLGFGATVRYHGNPRLIPDQGLLPGNAPGPGPFFFPGTAVFLDSSRNQFGIYISRGQRISSNGTNVVGIVLRQYLTSSGIIELFTSTDTGATWTQDPNLGTLRSPYIDSTPPDTYKFLTGVDFEGSTGAWYIRCGQGYSPVQICTLEVQSARGAWVGNYLICVPMEAITTGIPLLSEVIDTAGNVVSPPQTIFDQNAGTQDYRNGKIVCFGGGPSDGMNIKSSTDGGVTWTADSLTIYSLGTDTSFFYEYNNVILQDGSVGVLATLDADGHAFAGQHSAIQFFHKGRPKVTIFSPTMTQAAAFPMISRKDDNTLEVVFEYVPSGWDSVAWSIGRTFWDLGKSHSTDGGLTWSPVRNLTNTPTVSECCPQMARVIGSNNRMHITYGTSWRSSQPSDTADLYWAVQFGGASQVKTYNWYLRDSVPLGVEEQASSEKLPMSFELQAARPNPFSQGTTIRYVLPSAGEANLSVYNAAGQMVKTLVSGRQPAGVHTVQWDASKVTPGAYFCRLSAGGFSRTRQVVVLR